MTHPPETTEATAAAPLATAPASAGSGDGGTGDEAGPTRGRWRGRRSYRGTVAPYGFLTPTFVLLLVLMVTPIAMVIGYSFVDRVIINPNSDFVGFENYAQVLGDPVFFKAVSNTAIFAGASVIAHFVLGMGFALMLNSPMISNRLKAVYRAIYILPWLFTVAIVAVLWRMLLSPNGIVNFFVTELGFAEEEIAWLSDPSLALPAITFINIWAGYPFFMVSLLAGLQGISSELYEAARLDRAGPVKQFFNVTLPQLKPIIISMALLDFIWTTQQFALIWMTTGGGPIDATEMVSTYTYKLAFSTYDFAVASASAVIIFLLSMTLAFFYVRHQKSRD
ncbi:carbohydrate ABC transporter permease [Demequina muriae]|uniref:Sugar ABC transporter permease n=1 Tax=Demequina muriae TaxID=3051664 RepID=A0ABT8GE94_9MICO|nr:sugar ABC transporter permease [Demequina sp. EGI L300058]MDN4479750.1 sugar ABC transporter permease [Demequina sp. EGI L300058]